MKNLSLLLIVYLITFIVRGQQSSWKIVPGKITTPWADSVNANSPLPDYPRPQMERKDWQNLNGLWQYSVLPKAATDNIPADFQGNILVPFAIESALSGVKKRVGKDSVLWYNKVFDFQGKLKGKKLLIHFGAVDW